MSLSNKQIALVHVACKELGISEDDRHRIQKEVGGHQSLTKMSYKGWLELVRHLEACGFRGSAPPFGTKGGVSREPIRHAARRELADTSHGPEQSRRALISKIYVLWYQLAGTYYIPGKEKAALRGFLRKRFRVDHENFLDVSTAIKVIEAIKAISARQVEWD